MTEEELSLFKDAIKGTKKIVNHNITHKPARKISPQRAQQAEVRREQDSEFYFSDQFEPHFNEEGPMRYARDGVSKYEVKRLRRGVYTPEIYLDLHGMTQKEAKREIAALMIECVKEHLHCACVMHGIGKHILKKKTPEWLAQHPDVLAFHQAPLEFGGDGALLVLIDLPEYS
ncbi:endonuclease SmrB [Vibrio sp. SS-MA-C1-2]|uniref:endonuclease SmrB n=1 Tax=Vibrio sp. SS-MA-C1-2 TaxID=2908646 RepID=UPI001F35BC1E|nr:endonuclease SmrB [Vibrio sp. SS-MA-C1-2]UJF20171.1 endonuclease SmrB [Vibrio sp. SS-MA-C1-2]